MDFQANLPADWDGDWVAPELHGEDEDGEKYYELADTRSESLDAAGLVYDGTEQVGGVVYCWDEDVVPEVNNLRLSGTTVMVGDTAVFNDCAFKDVLFLSPAGSGNGYHHMMLFSRCVFTGTVRFAMEDVDGEPYRFFVDCTFNNAEIQAASSGFDFSYPRDELPFLAEELEEMPDDADTFFTDCAFEVVSTRGVAKSQVLNPVTWVHHY